jgi:hypothetical protein
MRKFGFILAAGAAAVGLATPALADSGHAVTATTHASDHPDTTSNGGPCTASSTNGPVWAYDNLALQLSASPESSPDTYSVTITAHGSFRQIADPNTGECATGHGSVDGWLQWDVSSSTPPDPANVPSQESSDVSQGDIVNQLFDGNGQIVGGGHYSYSYNQVSGSRYTQTG